MVREEFKKVTIEKEEDREYIRREKRIMTGLQSMLDVKEKGRCLKNWQNEKMRDIESANGTQMIEHI